MAMRTSFVIAGVLALTLAILAPGTARANDAEVLPEGIFKIGHVTGFDWSTDTFKTVFGAGTYPTTKWYNITVYLSDIAGPDAARQMDRFCEGGKCIVGKTHFDLFQSAIKFNTSLFYGITDNLTVGIIFPYVRSMGSSSLDVTDSNMGINYRKDGTIDPSIPIAPYSPSFPGVKDKIRNSDVETILSHPAFGFQYQKPLDMHEGWYLSDIILGSRYLFNESERWKNAFTIFFITPTGKLKNYNYLFDPANGDGQLDIGFWFNNDLVVSKKKYLGLTLNFSTGYTTQFPQTKKFRVGSLSRTAWDGTKYTPGDTWENPLPIGNLSSSYLELRRDIGDNVDFYAGFKWDILPSLSFSQEFYYYYKWRDMFDLAYTPMMCELVGQYDHDNRGSKYCGEPGADYGLANIQTHQLSLQTDREEVVSTSSLTFTSLPFVEEGKFPVPFFFTVGYKHSIAGKNIEQANSIFCSLDLVGSIYMFDKDFEKKMEEKEKAKKAKAAMGGAGMNYSLANQAMTK